MLLALGWNNERIAAALRITPPSLRRHYFSEGWGAFKCLKPFEPEPVAKNTNLSAKLAKLFFMR